VAVFVRADAELKKIAGFRPFQPSQIDAGTGVNIVLLADELDERCKKNVLALGTDTDEFCVHGREIAIRLRTGAPIRPRI
jgi:hypothetical protein